MHGDQNDGKDLRVMIDSPAPKDKMARYSNVISKVSHSLDMAVKPPNGVNYHHHLVTDSVDSGPVNLEISNRKASNI